MTIKGIEKATGKLALVDIDCDNIPCLATEEYISVTFSRDTLDLSKNIGKLVAASNLPIKAIFRYPQASLKEILDSSMRLKQNYKDFCASYGSINAVYINGNGWQNHVMLSFVDQYNNEFPKIYNNKMISKTAKDLRLNKVWKDMKRTLAIDAEVLPERVFLKESPFNYELSKKIDGNYVHESLLEIKNSIALAESLEGVFEENLVSLNISANIDKNRLKEIVNCSYFELRIPREGYKLSVDVLPFF